MSTGKSWVLAAAIGLAGSLLRAAAQQIIVEPIGPIALVPNQPIWLTFPDPIDPDHPKLVYFEGHASAVGAPQAILRLVFDYHLDPADPPQDPPTFSPPTDFSVSDSGTSIKMGWLIPECPPWVSIHFEANEVARVEGVFVHQCIPEPASLAAVATLGLVAFAGWRRCSTRATAFRMKHGQPTPPATP